MSTSSTTAPRPCTGYSSRILKGQRTTSHCQSSLACTWLPLHLCKAELLHFCRSLLCTVYYVPYRGLEVWDLHQGGVLDYATLWCTSTPLVHCVHIQHVWSALWHSVLAHAVYILFLSGSTGLQGRTAVHWLALAQVAQRKTARYCTYPLHSASPTQHGSEAWSLR